jgi:hypothetical protein
MSNSSNNIHHWRLSIFFSILISALDLYGYAGEIPESCSEPKKARLYNVGYSNGEKFTSKSWEKIDNCDNIEHFETLLIDKIKHFDIVEDEKNNACLFNGYVNAVLSEVNNIYDRCGTLCYNKGEIMGELAATAYCKMSLSGLHSVDAFVREPVRFCGFSYELACDVTFLYSTFIYSSDIGDCEYYTYGEYSEIWDQVRNIHCAYMIDISD